MKKLSISLVALSFVAAFSLSTPASAFADKGSQRTRTETTECESGVKVYCAGDGTLCDLTIGFDCEPALAEVQ